MSLFDQINTAETMNEQTTQEKHLPRIDIRDLGEGKHAVRVSIGNGNHPNETGHWIQWIELRMNGLFISRAEFSAKVTEPTAEFVVNCQGPCNISALARCNMHGLWEAKASCCA